MKNNNYNISNKRKLAGKVVSDKMDKTRVVEVERKFRHRVYGKVLRKSKKYYAHDEKNISSSGDEVLIEEIRPISKLKRWRVISLKERK
ncbi:MAG: 30S ribosomal protein S17 [Elusimicrobiota bacterium]